MCSFCFLSKPISALWKTNELTPCATVVTQTTLLCSLFPVYPTTTSYWLFFCPVPEPHRCYQIGQLWPCGLRGFKRLIDTSWVLWESREFAALQPIELLRRCMAQIICKKSLPVEVQTPASKWGSNEVNSRSRTFNDSLGLSKILEINSLIIDSNELWSGCTVGL